MKFFGERPDSSEETGKAIDAYRSHLRELWDELPADFKRLQESWFESEFDVDAVRVDLHEAYGKELLRDGEDGRVIVQLDASDEYGDLIDVRLEYLDASVKRLDLALGEFEYYQLVRDEVERVEPGVFLHCLQFHDDSEVHVQFRDFRLSVEHHKTEYGQALRLLDHARRLFDRKELVEAEKEAMASVDAWPGPDSLLLLGEIRMKLRKFKDAVVPLSSASAMHDGVRALVRLAEAYVAMGMPATAARTLEEVVRRNPRSEQVRRLALVVRREQEKQVGTYRELVNPDDDGELDVDDEDEDGEQL
jgi:tetratricopeptide (TPR) repeat protein